MKYLAALFAVFLVLGCVNNMSVEEGDHVSVDYTGKLEDGTVFDSGRGLEFDVGADQMIKGFDAAVIGMNENQTKTVTLQPEDAYGMPNPNYIAQVPIANVPSGTKVGDTLYAGGQRVVVTAVSNETVTIDANHPLAGKVLIFDIKVVKIVKK